MREREAPLRAARQLGQSTPITISLRSGQSKLSQASSLPSLNYYLTFIRYFGFTINPSDSSGIFKCSPHGSCWLRLCWLFLSLLGVLVKFTAIAFTLFIAGNHCIVLIDYIIHDTKVLVDLMLEVRLASTKLSALIFVLSWHWNQNQVRHLIKLVKSTNIYVSRAAPVSEQQRPPVESTRSSFECSSTLAQPAHSEEEVQPSQVLNNLDSSILRWWLMCICVTMLHFCVSEAELLRSYHLWQWLDEYSLHTLGNKTISDSTLMFLVSLDNYIYTVHVYGTRLVGASIICIVCSLQSESIAALEVQARQLIRVSPSIASKRQTSLCSWWFENLGVVAGCDERDPLALGARLCQPPMSNPRRGSQIKSTPIPGRLFILGECDWFLTDANGGQRLNSRNQLVERISKRLVRTSVWCSLRDIVVRHYVRSRCSSVTSSVRLSGTSNSEQQVTRATKNQLLFDSARTRLGPLGQMPASYLHESHSSSPGTPTGTRQQAALSSNRAELIERHLEQLASRYELVRQVNTRIDSCFGPMLLIQYSFLFFMSCIDVVYFSISFNPNTKTKCIIVSGMILLWWPYLLLYKFSSDIGCRSKDLLTTVRRLARLSLLERHSQAQEQETMSLAWLRPQCRLASKHLFHTNNFGKYKQSIRLVERSPWRPNRTTTSAILAGQCCLFETRPTIINKLDHVFKPTYLTLLGIMKVNKFFLLNFARIVITASVMMIQFISN